MQNDDDDREKPRKRKPYEPPRVLETAEFETLALSCNKIPDDAECEFQGATSS